MDLFRPTVSHDKHYDCNHCFFLFSLFSSSSLFLFRLSLLRFCDFGTYRVPQKCRLTLFHSNDCTFRWHGFEKISYNYVIDYV